jgi:hypothetical protein
VGGTLVALVAAGAAIHHRGEVQRMPLMHPRGEARLVRRGTVEGKRRDAVSEKKPRVSRAGRDIVDIDLADLHAVGTLGGRPRHDELDPALPGEVETVRLAVRGHRENVDRRQPRSIRAIGRVPPEVSIR